jgi:hypothetical protein
LLLIRIARRAVVLAHPGRDRHETAGEQVVLDLKLLVTRSDTGLVGHDPHLHEMHRVAVLRSAVEAPRVVLLGVLDAGPSTHPLGEAGVDDAGVTGRILVDQRTLQHPGDDLHVLVGMGVETHPRPDDVVVVDQQQAVTGVRGVVLAAERERVL